MKIEIRFGIIGAMLVCSLLAILSGCKKADDLAGAPSSPNTATVGTKFDDTIITSKVKSALLTDSEIKSSNIKVETSKGEVMLSGFVDDQYQMERSEATAKKVDGVRVVNNMLALKSGPSTVANKVEDSVVTAKVKSALLTANDLKSMDISVVTNKGDVQLSGFVDNDQQRVRAAEIAQGVDGVTAVTNQLSVKK